MPTELDTPENRLHPTDVTFLRRRIFTLDVFGAPIDFLFTYANEGDAPIHERTCARRIIYAVCVSHMSGVKLFPIYEARPMQRYGQGNSSHRILRRLRCT